MKKLLLALACTALFAADGELARPVNYREWIFLSSGLGMTYGPLAAQERRADPFFENVFVTPDAYHAFQSSGRWPDKTMFVLEIRNSQSKGSINKDGRFQSDIAAVEVEVKQGGQWTFYGFEKDGATGKAIPRSASCYSCHSSNGAADNTFVQFYPTLAPIAKAKGTFKSTAE